MRPDIAAYLREKGATLNFASKRSDDIIQSGELAVKAEERVQYYLPFPLFSSFFSPCFLLFSIDFLSLVVFPYLFIVISFLFPYLFFYFKIFLFNTSFQLEEVKRIFKEIDSESDGNNISIKAVAKILQSRGLFRKRNKPIDFHLKVCHFPLLFYCWE